MDLFLRNELIFDEDDSAIDKILFKPYEYIFDIPGKEIGQIFMRSLSAWATDVDESVILQLQGLLGKLHNVVLMLDDIQDDSPLRKGFPTAHTIFGTAATLLTIDATLAEIDSWLFEMKGPELVVTFINQLLHTLVGQSMELKWRQNSTCPTEGEYIYMARKKTGYGFNITSKLLDAFSKKTSSSTYMKLLGTYMQIWDDCFNLISERYKKDKGFAEDISEGKFGFPTLYVCNNNPEVAKVLKGILKKHTTDIEVKKRFIAIVKEYGGFTYSRKKLDEFRYLLQEEHRNLGENETIDGLFNAVDTWDGKGQVFKGVM